MRLAMTSNPHDPKTVADYCERLRRLTVGLTQLEIEVRGSEIGEHVAWGHMERVLEEIRIAAGAAKEIVTQQR
jgi:hypothetical protein